MRPEPSLVRLGPFAAGFRRAGLGPANMCEGQEMRHSLSILALAVALPVGFSALPLTVAHAADDGVVCEQQERHPWIECTVNQDTYSVTDVTLNGGSCPSPVPDDETLKLAKRFNNLLGTGNRILTTNMPPMMNIFGYYAAMCVGHDFSPETNIAATECPSYLATLKVKNNPVGNYQRADQFKVATFECDNVIELTIGSDDGATDTWNFAAGN
jgi:hypothetical protein